MTRLQRNYNAQLNTHNSHAELSSQNRTAISNHEMPRARINTQLSHCARSRHVCAPLRGSTEAVSAVVLALVVHVMVRLWTCELTASSALHTFHCVASRTGQGMGASKASPASTGTDSTHRRHVKIACAHGARPRSRHERAKSTASRRSSRQTHLLQDTRRLHSLRRWRMRLQARPEAFKLAAVLYAPAAAAIAAEVGACWCELRCPRRCASQAWSDTDDRAFAGPDLRQAVSTTP